MRRPIAGRADLLRLKAALPDARAEALAPLLGYRFEPLEDEAPTREPQAERSAETDASETATGASAQTTDAPPTPFWIPTRYARRSDAPASDDDPATDKNLTGEWRNPPPPPAPRRLLAHWPRIGPPLIDALTTPAQARELDADAAVDRAAKLLSLDPPPLRKRKSAPHQVQIVYDRATRLVPFWDDQDETAAKLIAHFGARDITRAVMREGLDEPTPISRNEEYRPPEPGGAVLAMTDLGALSKNWRRATETWRKLGDRIARARCRAIALIPQAPRYLDERLPGNWRIVRLQPRATGLDASDEARRQRVDEILLHLAPAVRLDIGLLRALRLSFGWRDATIEADLYAHEDLASTHCLAAALKPEARDRRIGELAVRARTGDEAQRERIRRSLALLRAWRGGDLRAEIWYDELTSMPAPLRALLEHGEEDLADAQAFFRSQTFVADGASRAWLSRVADRARSNAESWRCPDVARALSSVKKDDPSFTLPEGVDPKALETPDAPTRRLDVRQRGGGLAFGGAVGGLIATLESKNGQLAIEPRPDLLFGDGPMPDWAARWGEDNWGYYVEIEVGGVTQRLRWCPPGSFVMGSPEGEEGRNSAEGPQHVVTFSDGFWMFDTAVTHQLWRAVMGEERGAAPSPEHPVTEVSWEDAKAFCAALGERLPGFAPRLPSEAEWEYGCRAGTTTRYWWGDEFDAAMANIRSPKPVRSYPPNPWGLYETSGNVDEWCEDRWHADYEGAPVDGSAWTKRRDADRVVRGGSWRVRAWYVRSASRDGFEPSNRYVDLGFRCAGGHGVSIATSERAMARAGGRAAMPQASRLRLSTDLERVVIEREQRPAWAGAIGRDACGLWASFTVADIETRLRWIPPGRFLMGSPDGEHGRYDDEGPQHEVTIAKGFWLMATPVTQALYRAVTGKNPSRFSDRGDRRPVESVTWDDASAFCEKLGLRLPSEAEWEYACRAGTRTAYHFGEEPDAEAMNFDGKIGETSDVDRFPPNPWGLHDMHGNVWEWCADRWRGTYEGAPVVGSAWLEQNAPRDALRVVRGGSWGFQARIVRSACRGRYGPSDRDDVLGFRCAGGHGVSIASSERAKSGGGGARRMRRGAPQSQRPEAGAAVKGAKEQSLGLSQRLRNLNRRKD